MICVNDYTSRNGKVSCMYCQFEACRKCCQTYIIDQRFSKCMNNECDKEWTRKFMVDNFTKTFITKEWKEMKEVVLGEKEKALLPATQGILETRRRKKQIRDSIVEIDEQVYQLRLERRKLEEEHYRLSQTPNGDHTRKQFIRACPDEHCRGFLSTQWKCGTCFKWTCKDCNTVKGETHDAEHTCNPDDVETTKLLNADTKPCPKCATGIYKIEGCDQMWCTQCHTAFSWRTGRIETNIHNPHFYEWQRRQNNGEAPRVPGDIVCGRELTGYFIRSLLGKLVNAINLKLNGAPLPTALTPIQKQISDIGRHAIHIHEVVVPRYRTDHVENNVELRVLYLDRKITEEEFNTKIQRANKAFEKKREYAQIFHLYVQTITDIIFRLHDSACYPRDSDTVESMINTCHQYVTELKAIRQYANECLVNITQVFGSTSRKTIESY